MYATNYLETNFLKIFNGITLAAPATIYLALYLSDPTETGTAGIEVSYSGYVRQAVAFSTPAVENNGIGFKNTNEISFAAPELNVGNVTHIGLLDSVSGGNMLAYGKPIEVLPVSAGESPHFSINAIDYFLNGNLSVDYKTKLLNVFRGQNVVAINPHHALFNGNPESGGNELSGINYTRVALAFTTPSEGTGGQMYIENSAAAKYGVPGASWGNWSYSALYDGSAGGTPVAIYQEPTAKEIKAGYVPTMALGAVKVAIN